MLPSKVGAISAIAGALLLMVGTMLHPMSADPGDVIATFTEYAADTHWVATHLIQFFGIALMFVGLIAVRDVIRDESAEWIAKLGVIFGASAMTIAAVLQAVDGVALKFTVSAWSEAPSNQKPTAFMAAFAVRQIETGLASFVAILFGLTILLFGIAIVFSKRLPTWLGWIGLIGGLGTIAGGLSLANIGFSATAMNVGIPFNLIIVIWMILLGVIQLRRS
jgi:hypothetical protein